MLKKWLFVLPATLGLALIVGSSNVINPQASVAMIVPAFIYLAAWYVLAGAVYLFLGIETRGRSIEEIHDELIKDVRAEAQRLPA